MNEVYIQLDLIDHPGRNITKKKVGYLLLTDHFLIWDVEYETEDRDESDEWYDAYRCSHTTIRKSMVSCVALDLNRYDEGGEIIYLWELKLSASGTHAADDVRIFFREADRNKAEAMRDKILTWLYPNYAYYEANSKNYRKH